MGDLGRTVRTPGTATLGHRSAALACAGLDLIDDAGLLAEGQRQCLLLQPLERCVACRKVSHQQRGPGRGRPPAGARGWLGRALLFGRRPQVSLHGACMLIINSTAALRGELSPTELQRNCTGSPAVNARLHSKSIKPRACCRRQEGAAIDTKRVLGMWAGPPMEQHALQRLWPPGNSARLPQRDHGIHSCCGPLLVCSHHCGLQARGWRGSRPCQRATHRSGTRILRWAVRRRQGEAGGERWFQAAAGARSSGPCLLVWNDHTHE